MAWKTDWKVIIGDQDMSAKMRPFLTDLSVTDKDGQASDTCSLTFDDEAGQIRLPTAGTSVVVRLDGVQVFKGVSDVPKSSGSRGGGRLLKVAAKGFDARGKVKEPQHFHQDDGTVGSFLEKLAKRAGFNMKVAPELANIARDYLVADGESFLHSGERLARELGGTFKLRGLDAVLAKRGMDLGLPMVVGNVGPDGANVISWDIAPTSTRSRFTKIKVRYFDRQASEFKEVDAEVESEDSQPEAVNVVRSVAADKSQAEDVATARREEVSREGGGGTVELDLAPEAQAEGLFQLTGARPGIDGIYRIVSVTHRASRSGGATTRLELKQPSGAAGKDSR
ncbi:phage late control D family protein [Roseibium algae]|uniref:Late control D family protein n=1 Tax=Roseibium algae TaxID=3123038 RepID=A0ABU8TJU9_9HYPH